MTIDDITVMVRSGILRLILCKQEEDHFVLDVSIDPALFTPELCQAFQQHQIEIFKMINRSDIQICIAPDEHRASYLFKIDSLGKVRMCPICATMREEEVRNLTPPSQSYTASSS